jgi:hypothetical protein
VSARPSLPLTNLAASVWLAHAVLASAALRRTRPAPAPGWQGLYHAAPLTLQRLTSLTLKAGIGLSSLASNAARERGSRWRAATGLSSGCSGS